MSDHESITVAALYVDKRGPYASMPGVDCWDVERDARLYEGPHPVVAHPPCTRWCRLAGLVEARWGYKKGDDGGLFARALEQVRRWGGVLEHPAYSDAWAAHDLNRPPTGGGWVNADFEGGWTCYVEQGRYGHKAKKATWLLMYGARPPALRWGCIPDGESRALVSWCGNHTKTHDTRPRLGKRAAAETPVEFARLLVAMARECGVREEIQSATAR